MLYGLLLLLITGLVKLVTGRVPTGLARYVRTVWVAVDQYWNAALGGDEDETISSRAAKARIAGRRWGCVFCRLLDAIDRDHCAASLEPDEGEKA